MKRRLLTVPLLLLCLTQVSAMAEDAALGRLFLTPAQRSTLDHQRQLNPDMRNTQEQAAAQTLNGTVRRSAGRNTHWVNGEADWNGTTQVPRIPVGDTYHPENGERDRLLGNGQITVHRGQRAP